MGLIVAFVFLIGLVISLIIYKLNSSYCAMVSRADKKSYKPVLVKYFLIGVAAGYGLSYWVNSGNPSSGAPTGDVYMNWIIGALLLGLSPGVAAIVGRFRIVAIRKKNQRESGTPEH